jgi:exo-beta-1,3-glucanase (GH17 family)
VNLINDEFSCTTFDYIFVHLKNYWFNNSKKDKLWQVIVTDAKAVRDKPEIRNVWIPKSKSRYPSGGKKIIKYFNGIDRCQTNKEY